jgi:hypothetical protein
MVKGLLHVIYVHGKFIWAMQNILHLINGFDLSVFSRQESTSFIRELSLAMLNHIEEYLFPYPNVFTLFSRSNRLFGGT